ncbi:hypothetical protein LINGRAPRIM_LOCUS1283 [Linum grandiflorum]
MTTLVGHHSPGLFTTIIAITVTTSLVLSPSHVNGDAALKEKVCTKSPWPKACNMCFDTKKEETDQKTLRELAGFAITCAYEKAHEVKMYFHFPKSGHKNCYQCEELVIEVGANLIHAYEKWQVNDYTQSIAHLDIARDYGQRANLGWKDCKPEKDGGYYDITLMLTFIDVAKSLVGQTKTEGV